MSDWDDLLITSSLLIFMEYGGLSIGDHHRKIVYLEEPTIISSYMNLTNSSAQTDLISAEQTFEKTELDLKALSFSL